MDKQQAARLAVEAGTVAAQAVNDYGLDSPQAYGALETATAKTATAAALGCTRQDYDEARNTR